MTVFISSHYQKGLETKVTEGELQGGDSGIAPPGTTQLITHMLSYIVLCVTVVSSLCSLSLNSVWGGDLECLAK